MAEGTCATCVYWGSADSKLLGICSAWIQIPKTPFVILGAARLSEIKMITEPQFFCACYEEKSNANR